MGIKVSKKEFAIIREKLRSEGKKIAHCHGVFDLVHPGHMEHFKEALTDGKADAALAASLFHFKELEIREVKKFLANEGIPVRL